MAELRPFPLAALARRMFAELDARDAIFDLPRRKWAEPLAGKDLSVSIHGRPAATPLGPAAGPQSQMAQNLVLSWLAGGRVMELKTVQVNDQLEIPRPCIDMQTVGYNVEWSQELTLPESLDEYVKGSMLIELLAASGRTGFTPEQSRTVLDMSVGYDLAGIRGDTVQAFIRGMMDAKDAVERLRRELPPELGPLRDLDFTTRLSDTLTLSTFHGCPPDEIEKIVDFLLEENGLHCVVKLNPMLLGPTECRRLLHEVMGYDDIVVPDSAFTRDASWDQATDFVGRLAEKAHGLGLGFGVKLTNTLIVENRRDFFPRSEKEMYLSGPPLHVLASALVGKVRGVFGDAFPISFSAGIDAKNFADACALGLVPITVCSDWLKPGGYGRGRSYFAELERRMDAVGARDLDELQLLAWGQADAAWAGLGLDADDPRHAAVRAALATGAPLRPAAGDAFEAWVSAARLRNTPVYVERVEADPRYAKAKNSKPPKKIGSQLELLDCVSCDKCIPVCPNDANFAFVLPTGEIPVVRLSRVDGAWVERRGLPVLVKMKHQLANFADFCNECGNCDVFCPEDGGPYVVKPRFFGRLSDYVAMSHLDGFHLEEEGELGRVRARFSGRAFELELGPWGAHWVGEDFDLRFDPADPVGTMEGTAEGEVDLTYFLLMSRVRDAVLAEDHVSYVRSLVTAPDGADAEPS